MAYQVWQETVNKIGNRQRDLAKSHRHFFPQRLLIANLWSVLNLKFCVKMMKGEP
jgi:hypothetical protein